MKYLSLLVLVSGIATSTQAKSWRVNNNAGVAADFTSLGNAINSNYVTAGDTIYVEPSANDYANGGAILNKKLVIIGPGYFLDPGNTTSPGNGGLQALPLEAHCAWFAITAGGNDSKIMGITSNGIYLRNASNIVIERVRFASVLQFEQGTNTNITVRKCFFNNNAAINHSSAATASNFVCENNIFYSNNLSLACLTGSGNIVRNNSFYNSNSTTTLVNAYFVNNIVGSITQFSLTNCTIKNNLFQINQALPATATNNLVNQNMADIYVGTGSMDGRVRIKAGSPAAGAGLTVGAVVSPDCGAFGGPDPYKLSGIPNVPTIYNFTAPTSIPSGSATMNITFSTRNNN